MSAACGAVAATATAAGASTDVVPAAELMRLLAAADVVSRTELVTLYALAVEHAADAS